MRPQAALAAVHRAAWLINREEQTHIAFVASMGWTRSGTCISVPSPARPSTSEADVVQPLLRVMPRSMPKALSTIGDTLSAMQISAMRNGCSLS